MVMKEDEVVEQRCGCDGGGKVVESKVSMMVVGRPVGGGSGGCLWGWEGSFLLCSTSGVPPLVARRRRRQSDRGISRS